jgi:hypothetical protein
VYLACRWFLGLRLRLTMLSPRAGKSGSLSKFTAILRASSFVSSLAAERRPGSSYHIEKASRASTRSFSQRLSTRENVSRRAKSMNVIDGTKFLCDPQSVVPATTEGHYQDFT